MNTRSMVYDNPGNHTGQLGSSALASHALRVDERSLSALERDAAVRGLPTQPNDPLLQVLGTMRMGAMLVAADGHVIYLNDAGKEALGAHLGLALRGDQIVAVAPDARRKLAVALSNACRPPFIDGAVLLTATNGSGIMKPLRVLSMERIAGLTRRVNEGLALLCIASVRQRTPEAPMLAQLFGLTAAESALMAAIAGGERLHQCAARRGVSLATVRAQLRNVFVKTGAATQADLTFIAWSIPGLWIN
jgi:DNA-binding CsgD family transcriptional regulator